MLPYKYGTFLMALCALVLHVSEACIFASCKAPLEVPIPVAALQMPRAACYCMPLLVRGCAPPQTIPFRVLSGQPSTAKEPAELVHGCNRDAPCMSPPAIEGCHPQAEPYDLCVCYGPGTCVCFVYEGKAVAPWARKPPCYCSPAVCNDCIGAIQPTFVIDGPIDHADPRAVVTSHGCDWKAPCEPPPPCGQCSVRNFDQCICYGKELCTCWSVPVKPPCYCSPAVCNKCFALPGFPNQIINNKGQASFDPTILVSGCDALAPCLPTPMCTPCSRLHMKFESCIYFGPGLNACFQGRSGSLG